MQTQSSSQLTFTTAGAARFVGVAKRTIERWRQHGTLRPALRTTGGHSRYTRRQLEPLRREYGGQAEHEPVFVPLAGRAAAFPWNND